MGGIYSFAKPHVLCMVLFAKLCIFPIYLHNSHFNHSFPFGVQQNIPLQVTHVFAGMNDKNISLDLSLTLLPPSLLSPLLSLPLSSSLYLALPLSTSLCLVCSYSCTHTRSMATLPVSPCTTKIRFRISPLCPHSAYCLVSCAYCLLVRFVCRISCS